MRSGRLLPLLLLTGAIAPPLVYGDVFTFTGQQSSRWGDDDNWLPTENAPPGAGDKAIIPNGKSCLVDTDEAVEHARRIGARRTFFTHIAHELLHAQVNAELPDGMQLSHDGLLLIEDE